MHMFYENAAQLLLVMTRVGLGIKAGSDCHAILMRLAQHHMRALTGELRDLSHAGAASWILDDLEKGGFVTAARRRAGKSRPRSAPCWPTSWP
jgi:hypothetical protein